jgi:hypothetical protein
LLALAVGLKRMAAKARVEACARQDIERLATTTAGQSLLSAV